MNVLIVEDEAIIALMLQEILLSVGHQVIGIAANAERAKVIATEELPDVALLDIRLGKGGSGVEVARWLKQQGVPSLFITGSPQDAEANRDAVLGYVPKPFGDYEVIAALRMVQDVINQTP